MGFGKAETMPVGIEPERSVLPLIIFRRITETDGRRQMKAGSSSAHQLQGIGEEFRAAEIAGFQRQQHRARLRADGAQHRHAGRDFRAHQKAGNFQAIHHRAGGFTAGNHQPPDAGLHQALRDIGHRLLDRVARGIAAVARLQRRDLVRRRTAGDQDRTFTEMFIGPAKCALRLGFARDRLFGIEMKHRHDPLGVGDLLQRRLRTTAGQARRRSADRRVGHRVSAHSI